MASKVMLISLFLGTFYGQNDFENAVKYSLNLDRDEVHSGEVVTLSAKLPLLFIGSKVSILWN